MKNLLFIVGTRPEAIKLAPLIKAFYEEKQDFRLKVCATGQHPQMVAEVFDFFKINDYNTLDTMVPGQSLNALSAKLISAIEKALESFNPDIVFVQGDTNSSMAGALASFYFGTKIAHVEAGLRTYNNRNPFPEEMNRKLIGQIADWHFAPTQRARMNLTEEGIAPKRILISGNTIIDALNIGLASIEKNTYPSIENIKQILSGNEKPFILATVHRRENKGKPVARICTALLNIAQSNQVNIVMPVHPNQEISSTIRDMLSNHPSIKLIEPVPYPGFLWLMKNSAFILTDSGGIQEEASGIGKNVILLRENTERKEAIAGGFVYKAGSDVEKIVSLADSFLSSQKDPVKKDIFGHGDASKKIVNFIQNLHDD
jgi:UDP-N-acetylglucosamine 2-epimerase (non-hydrolysing)